MGHERPKRLGSFEGALGEFPSNIRQKPQIGAMQYHLARATEGKGDGTGALQEFVEACALEPGNSEFQSGFDRLGRIVEALRHPSYGPSIHQDHIHAGRRDRDTSKSVTFKVVESTPAPLNSILGVRS